MAKPTPKAQPINAFLKQFMGVDRVESIVADQCVMCGQEATEFRDQLSRREFSISGMCQKCQDNIFGV